MADLLSAKLINGNAADADVFTRRLSHGQTGEKVRCLGVVPITAVTVLFVETRENENVLLVRRQRLERKGKLEFRARLRRKPVSFPDPVWKIKTRQPHRRLDV